MRTAILDLEGRHILCLSLRAVQAITEQYGDIPSMIAALGHADAARRTADTLWVLRCLADAGDRYARLNGQENAPLPAELEDCLGPYDMAAVRTAIFAAISNGQYGTIRTKPKNAETAQTAL